MKKKKTVDQLLPCYPQRLLEWETDEETGRITVFRPKYYSNFAKKIMSPFLKKDYFSVKLDDLGSNVWRLCDGKYSVEEIGKELASRFGPEIEPIYERLARFLIQLHKGKFIEIRCPKSD
ncbi:MAG TPA: PqqD family protein [Calditrichaeota bacterium]|nr:PqqD family protein [Calditrichota bacterium]